MQVDVNGTEREEVPPCDLPEDVIQAVALAIGAEYESLREWDREAFARAALKVAVPLIRSQARREAASHVLAVVQVRNGLRCPHCHGVARSVSVSEWECQEGHRYRRGFDPGPEYALYKILRNMARDDELPLMPTRRPLEGADAVLRQST